MTLSSGGRPVLVPLSPGWILFRLKLFGSASIEGPRGPLTGRAVQRRRLGLLALLAVARTGVAREKLIGYLWPDSDADRARHLLSDSVYRINQAVGGEAVLAVGDELRLNPDRLPSDVWEFADAIEKRDWQRAVTLCGGPFLDGFFLTDAEELEKWVDAQRERLSRERARALEELAEAAEGDGAPTDAVHWWRELAAHDPYSSRIALRLMRVLDRTGDRAAAIQHARIHTILLDEEMGLAPDAELVEFAATLRTRSAHTPIAAHEEQEPGAREGFLQSAPDISTVHPPGPQTLPPPGPQTVPPPGPHVSTMPPPPARGNTWRRAVVAVGLTAMAGVTAFIVDGRVEDNRRVEAIAVLPFADLSADRAYEYFADGMTEELIARLSHVDGLRVVSRTSAFAFKGRAVDVRDAAAQLNATAVLQGSVRHMGDTIRIVAQLTDGRNGYELWTDTYQRELGHVFAIQDDIARQIVRHLQGRIAGIAAAVEEPGAATRDPVAFNLYLKGRYNWHRRSERSLHAAADYFRQATERAPTYARAHAGLADAYAILGFYDYMPPRDAFPAAAAAAQRAFELEPSLGEPHATLGYIALYYEWDWARAETELRRAIELEPDYSTGHQWYANYLTAMGRFEEAVAQMQEAMQLDPLSVIANAALGWVLYYSRDYKRAIEQCTRALDLDPEFGLAYLWRAMAHEQRGEMDKALRDFEAAVRLSGGSTPYIALHARALALAGRRAEALVLVRQLEGREGTDYLPPYEMAKVHDALGDSDAALQALERAYEHRSHSIAFLAVDPQLERLRDEPRFQELIRRAGLN